MYIKRLHGYIIRCIIGTPQVHQALNVVHSICYTDCLFMYTKSGLPIFVVWQREQPCHCRGQLPAHPLVSSSNHSEPRVLTRVHAQVMVSEPCHQEPWQRQSPPQLWLAHCPGLVYDQAWSDVAHGEPSKSTEAIKLASGRYQERSDSPRPV